MRQKYLLGIDVGTSSTKTALWSEDFRLVAEATAEYRVEHPQPVWAQIDPQHWWQAVCHTVHAVLAKSGVPAKDVAGIGVDGIGWALVCVDAARCPIFPSLIWLDRRAEMEAAWLRSLPDANRLVHLTGNPLDPAYITAKLVWLRRNHLEIFQATRCFLTCTGYIVSQLCGEFTCDFTQGYSFHLFDMQQNCWDERATELLGVAADQLPPLYAPTDVVGGVSRQAAAMTGLSPGTPVIAGAVDAAAGAFGSGVTQVGQAADQGGTAFGMILCVDRFIVEPRLILSRHILPGQYLFQGGTVGGGVLRWFWDTLGPWANEGDGAVTSSPFTLMSQEAAKSPPGANGLIFLPYMAGERTPIWNSDARGVFFGLSYSTSRSDMLRALMEGCAYAVYHNIVVAQGHDVPVSEWIGAGGAARNSLWCQIKADISGIPFTVPLRADGMPGDNTLGLAVMTAHAVGLCDHMAVTLDSVLSTRTVYSPSAARHTAYQELFQIYLGIARDLQPDFAQMANRQSRTRPL